MGDSPGSNGSTVGRHDVNTQRRFATIETISGKFRIRTMSAVEMRRFRLWLAQSEENRAQDYEGLIARCWVDADDQLILSPSEVEHGYFDAWDSGLISGLGEACDRFCGFKQEAFNVREIGDTAKN